MALATPGVGLPASLPSTPSYAHSALCRPQLAGDAAKPREGEDELIATIRTWEGEALAQPPLLFKLVVALGAAMLGGAGLLVLGLAL